MFSYLEAEIKALALLNIFIANKNTFCKQLERMIVFVCLLLTSSIYSDSKALSISMLLRS